MIGLDLRYWTVYNPSRCLDIRYRTAYVTLLCKVMDIGLDITIHWASSLQYTQCGIIVSCFGSEHLSVLSVFLSCYIDVVANYVDFSRICYFSFISNFSSNYNVTKQNTNNKFLVSNKT
jgi:hypothetical protein